MGWMSFPLSCCVQVLFIAVNCWWNQGKCRKNQNFYQYPVIHLFYRRWDRTSVGGEILFRMMRSSWTLEFWYLKVRGPQLFHNIRPVCITQKFPRPILMEITFVVWGWWVLKHIICWMWGGFAMCTEMWDKSCIFVDCGSITLNADFIVQCRVIL